MVANRTVTITILADAAQAEAVVAQLGAVTGVTGVEMDKTAVQTDGLLARFEKLGPFSQAGVAGVRGLANAFTGFLGPAQKSVTQGLDQIGTSTTEATAATTSLIGPIAAGAVAVGAAGIVVDKSVTSYLNYADAVRQMQGVTDSTSQDSSKLVGTLREAGLTTDEVSAQFVHLGKAADTGVLDKYGVAVARNSDGTTNFAQTLGNVADAYNSNTDAASRDAEMTAIFGRNFTQLIPLLQNYKELAAESNTPILTPEQLKAAEQFQINLSQLKTAASNLATTVGSNLVPALSQTAAMMTDVAKSTDDALSHFDLLGRSANFVSDVTNGLWRSFAAGADAIHGDWHDAWRQLADEAQQGAQNQTNLGDATEQTTAEIQAQAAAMSAGTDAATGYANDSIAAQQAVLNVSQVKEQWDQQQAQAATQRAAAIKSAQQSLSDAEKSAAQQSISDSQSVGDAKQRLADTERSSAQSIKDATESVAKAQQSLYDLEVKQAEERESDSQKLLDAQQKVERVKQDIGSGTDTGVQATRDYQDAEENLAAVQASNADDAVQQAADKRDALQSLSDAQSKQAQAEQTAAENIEKAQTDLARTEQKAAQDRVTANANIAKAQSALQASYKTTGVTADQYRAHVLAVESAELQAKEATGKVKDDIDALRTGVQNGTIDLSAFNAQAQALGLSNLPTIYNDLQNLLGLITNPAQQWQDNVPTKGTPAKHSAKGNHLAAGEASWVGEGGPEQFVPDVAGTVIPNGGTGTSVPAQVNMNVAVTVDTSNGVVVASQQDLDALGDAVGRGAARKVYAEMLRWQNGGERLRLNGRR